ncbi:VWA domain-containing protein [Psychromonas arctica]|uniref:VWA domain-containing protein n=1 Tax=Psychromonas arctica TaxID=168275 RepID=A0ABU9HEY0_9GAMM
MFKHSKVAIAITLSGLLVACDSDNTTNVTEDTGDSKSVSIAGSLVSPQGLEASTRSSTAIKSLLTKSVECPDVPEGYEPLSNAVVELKDAAGETVTESVTTDSCGTFEFEVSDDVVTDAIQVRAEKEGFKVLFSDINNFLSGSLLKVASTISEQASYEISGLKQSSDNTVNLIVTDTVSNKAVIGLASDQFTFTLNDVPVSGFTITSAQNVEDNASSVVLSIDASGSMDTTVYDENYSLVLDSEGNRQNRYTIAAASAHQLIDMTKNNEADSELSVLLFSSDVFPMTDEVIANKLYLQDENGDEVIFTTGSENGFIKESATLHTLIDLYNPYSEMYTNYYSSYVTRHEARTDTISSASYYPFSGGTAFYDSLDVAIDQFSDQTSNPKVIALTDGEDNNSSIGYQDVIDKAISANVPITVVAVGFSSDSDNYMKNIAEDTGSQYIPVADISNLAGVFSGISTQLTFNSDVEFNEQMVAGDTLKVTADIDGDTIERELDIN